ncbi:MAG: DUF1517 domain-containing protein [Gemmatimonadaceae bacterium]|nr:DUF1517 domain-containing protein [Gloeobacterales cyanobacterium ES-bin-141]
MSDFKKSLLRRVVALGMVLGLALGSFSLFADSAWAQRRSSGGRIGGGSFSSPGRTYSPPGGGGRYAPGYGGGGYGYGGGVPFFIPIPFGGGYGGGYGGGGFGLGSVLLLVVVAGAGIYIFRFLRSARSGGGYGAQDSGTIEVSQVQVAMLSSAKQLQKDLNQLALSADTTSQSGLARLTQEVSIALLRHPEYWIYAKSSQADLPRLQAEESFNRLALTERTKYTDETLSNVGSGQRALPKAFDGANPDEVAEYIVATLLVAVEMDGPKLPEIRTAEDLRQTLTALGGASSSQILAVEVIWTPQAENDTLTADELLTQYPDLVRL